MTEIKNLIIENEELHARNEFLQRQVTGLRLELQRVKSESRYDYIGDDF